MKKALIIIIFGLAWVAGGIYWLYWFTPLTSALDIKSSFTCESMEQLRHPCGALTDEESLGRFGITNSVAAAILGTNDFSARIWIFSNLPIGRLSHSRASEMIFLVPSNAIPDGRLYFAAVRKVPDAWVKMTSPDREK